MSVAPIMTRTDRAERHRRLVRQYEAGTSTYALADQYGLSRSHVCSIVRLYGVVRRPGRPNKVVEAA